MKVLRKTFSNESTCLFDMEARSIDEVFAKTIQHLVDVKLLAPGARDEIVGKLGERERKSSTAIGHAVAVPHCYLDSMIEQTVVFVRLKDPLNLGAPDHIATRYLFILLGPKAAAADHIDTLALIARLMSDEEFRFDLNQADKPEGLLRALDKAIGRATPAPADVTHTLDGMDYSGRLCGGLIADVRRVVGRFTSDFVDGFHPKTLASTLFLFFACLAPAVTFGGLMATGTTDPNGVAHIGAVEMLTATAICGVIYALFAGQPLIILGGTGPLLIFTVILFNLCQAYEIPFFPTYAWVGIWTSVLMLVLAITDASCWIRYFTRFTDEIFAALISIIFIVTAIEDIFLISEKQEAAQHHAVAVLSVLLALGTFYIAISLQGMRRSRYMLPWIREFLADFGPTIAIVVMTIVAFVYHEIYLDKLAAPTTFGPTKEDRSWLINPFDAPVWVQFATIGPAILATILIYLDQNITARIVNAPDHNLQKGGGYHLDLALVGVLVGFCSVFGLPWLVAATVRSLNHVRSLATTEEVVGASGERRDRILHVRENRVTALAIHLMVGASLLLLVYLKEIPYAVLYGLFLFMGIVSMRGNQFFERLSLWVMQPSLYPATHYIRRVPIWTIHSYTAIQLGCLVVLWLVKESDNLSTHFHLDPPIRLGILFPLFIALLVPLRFWMSQFFRPAYLKALDAEAIPEEEETQWS
ncbi:MAG: PTS sugar transporter subunit IIA [Gemmataceae bacterium]